jgi:CheY-like chemotaxis protein
VWPAVSPRTPLTGGTPTRVLVVDDEEAIRRLLARLLAKRGYEVAEAMTVDDAVALVETFKPGLLICDVRMPDGGGVALHRRLREAHPEIIRGFIFITGDPASMEPRDPELVDAAILEKPFTAADLDALLAQIVPVRARQRPAPSSS